MKIVILDGFALNPGDLSYDNFKKLGTLTIYDRTADDLIYERAKDADVLLTNKTPIDKQLMKKLNKLKYIGILATGYNVVDIEAAKNKKIIVTNVPKYSRDSVVQMVFAYILEKCQHVKIHDTSVKNGEWVNSKDFCYWKYPLIELKDKVLGIIGMGSIGKQVAKVALAFGMKVIVYSRTMDKQPKMDYKWVTKDILFKNSDFITIHCPLFKETKKMINSEALKLMKKSVYLINTSRGPIIDDKDLAYALNNNIISGAAIDVMTNEPPNKNNQLLCAKNIIITPHIAWATIEARERLINVAYDNLVHFISKDHINVVNND